MSAAFEVVVGATAGYGVESREVHARLQAARRVPALACLGCSRIGHAGADEGAAHAFRCARFARGCRSSGWPRCAVARTSKALHSSATKDFMRKNRPVLGLALADRRDEERELRIARARLKTLSRQGRRPEPHGGRFPWARSAARRSLISAGTCPDARCARPIDWMKSMCNRAECLLVQMRVTRSRSTSLPEKCIRQSPLISIAE